MRKQELINFWHEFNANIFEGKLNFERISFTKNWKLYGSYNFGIKINNQQSDFMILSTLAHEMCHQAQEQLLKLKFECNGFHGETFEMYKNEFLKLYPDLEI